MRVRIGHVAELTDDEIDEMARAIYESSGSTNTEVNFPLWAQLDDVSKQTFRLHARAAARAFLACWNDLQGKKMTAPASGVALLHIFEQVGPHMPAVITGNRDGLLALRTALDQILSSSEALAFGDTKASAADGNEYLVELNLIDHQLGDDQWNAAPLPGSCV